MKWIRGRNESEVQDRGLIMGDSNLKGFCDHSDEATETDGPGLKGQEKLKSIVDVMDI